jgi:hypothetical protein
VLASVDVAASVSARSRFFSGCCCCVIASGRIARGSGHDIGFIGDALDRNARAIT